MPAYNRARFLERAINSVLFQDCVNDSSIELIIVNDGSIDNTDSVVQKIIDAGNPKKHTIKYHKIDHIGEPGTVRNIALDMANGEYIAYCDSDDYWLPHHLATAMQRFNRNPDLGMVSNYWSLAEFEMTHDSINTKIVVQQHPTWAVNTNCRVHKKSCIATVGKFNTSRWGEDGDFFSRVENSFKHEKTGIITSVNGYIKGGNNLTYQFDQGVKQRYY